MNKVIVRTITGIVYIALLVAATVCGSYVFLAVYGLLLAFGMGEMLSLCAKGERPNPLTAAIDIVGGLAIFASAYLYCSRPCPGANPVWAIIGYSMLRGIAQLYLKTDAIRNLAISYMSLFTVALPMSLLCMLYFEPDGNGPSTLLACLIFIWVNDTGAFCVGSLIGRHRLFERISPKKSWEGFFGGLFFTVIAGIIIGVYFPGHFPEFTLTQWIGLAAAVTVFATWGDLIESAIKRSAGKKDSGKLLPGHGGVLDRIDSLLLVIPAALIYIYIFI